jgi:flagellin
MSFSVNTNYSAAIALQVLNQTNRDLDVTQNRINTGKKVSTAKDNGAVYAISQGLRSDLAGLSAKKSGLDRQQGIVDTAIAAGTAVSDLLTQLKEKAAAANDANYDSASQAKFATDYTSLTTEITALITSASFSGSNLLSGVALAIPTAATASGAVAGVDLSIAALNTALSSFGAQSRQIESQRAFTTQLSDVIEAGIGNLVDADLARESAKLQALQVKQQLGLQALSIANSAPQSVLALFR